MSFFFLRSPVSRDVGRHPLRNRGSGHAGSRSSSTRETADRLPRDLPWVHFARSQCWERRMLWRHERGSFSPPAGLGSHGRNGGAASIDPCAAAGTRHEREPGNTCVEMLAWLCSSWSSLLSRFRLDFHGVPCTLYFARGCRHDVPIQCTSTTPSEVIESAFSAFDDMQNPDGQWRDCCFSRFGN